MSNLWQFRAAESDDLPLIFSSWLKSYRDYSTVSGCPNGIYYDRFHGLISNILSNPATLCIVACDPNDSKSIFGYVVAELGQASMTFHWCYVKHPLRNFGLARALEAEINSVKVDKTYYSSKSRLARKEYIYNPFELWKFL
jgi:hypothetical protein